VMRGESCVATLAVTNSGRWGGVTLAAYDRCGAAVVPVPVLRLHARATTTVRYHVPTDRRGVVHIGPLRLARRDPFGLARAERDYGTADTVWVYPTVHPLAAVPIGARRNPEGQSERVPHGNLTFDALREYVPGDELRHVHWRTSARVGELMVREHVDTSRPVLVVLLDDRAGVHTADSFEAACEGAASVVAAALRAELNVRLLTIEGVPVQVEPGSPAYLTALAEAVPLRPGDHDDSVRLRAAVDRVRLVRDADTLVCLTGAAGPDDLATVAGLRAGFSTILVARFGPRLPAGVAAPGLRIVDAADGREFASIWDGSWL
jgi:uncharacterized protein (DUF58 family)